MGTRRYVYNKVLEKIKKDREDINFFNLRNKYVTSKGNPNVSKWEANTPKDIRAGAIRDVVKNYSSVFSLLKNKQISKFNMGFSSKKKETSIEIPLSSIKATKFEIKKTEEEIEKTKKKVSDKKKVSETKNCVKITKKDGGVYIYKDILCSKIRISKRELKKEILVKYDCRLQVKYNEWYLIVPCDVKEPTYKKERNDLCALDPGVRSFQTIYSEEKVVQIKINKELLDKLKNKLDHMASLRDKKLIKKSSYKKREYRIYKKIGHLIDEMHHKTIDYITKNYQSIIIPPFESQDMVTNSRNRRLNRNLLELKHYMFRSRLESKCILRGCSMIVNTEEYTSKTCGRCGNINEVGSKDIFTCNKCKLSVDRDVNGARNIYIKTINKILC
jgi:transposase